MDKPELQMLKLGIKIQMEQGKEDSILGKGGFGVVRRGTYVDDAGHRHAVAIKYANELPKAKALRSLGNELKIFDKLKPHQHIIRCFGGNLGKEDGFEDSDSGSLSNDGFYVVLELMDMSLHELIHSPVLPQHRTYCTLLGICAQVADGLHHLHTHRVIHYDIKPSNVLLDKSLNAKLADFGLARMKLGIPFYASFNGHLCYMAPEVMNACHMRNVRATQKLDIYSLGILIWECVTRKQLAELTGDKVHSPEPDCPPPGEAYVGTTWLSVPKCTPTDLVNLIAECVQTKAEQRPSSEEVRDCLWRMAEAPWADKCPWDADPGVPEVLPECRGVVQAVMSFPHLNMELFFKPSVNGSSSLRMGSYASVDKGTYVDGCGITHKVIVKYASSRKFRNSMKKQLEIFGRVPLHPNVIRCFGGRFSEQGRRGVGIDRNTYLAFEEMDRSFQRVLEEEMVKRREGKTDLRYSFLLQIFHDLASGLSHLHRNDVVYCNLNPQNVLLGKDGRAKLGSFMHAKLLPDIRCGNVVFENDIRVVSPRNLDEQIR